MDLGHLKRTKPRCRKPSDGFYHVQRKRNTRVVKFLKEYAHESTIHGISQIFKENETCCHRMTWAVILLLSTSCAGYLAIKSYLNNAKNPIAITINDTQFPLEKVWFPAVVFCPSNKIILKKAHEYLANHLKDRSVLNETSLMEFYKSLVLLQHPLYIQMESYLKHCEELLPQLANVNITALMYYSLPKCEDLFNLCYWQGNQTNCCHKFSLQRSEEGFCYSFNSLTSEGLNSSCKYFDAHNEKYKGCQLEIVNSYGPSTGLQVYFKILDPEKYPTLDFTDGPKFKVQVFHPSDFPQPGIFSLVPLNGLNKLSVEIKPTITRSTERIKRFTVEERNCIFKEEVHNTKIARTFSQETCLLECRMAFLLHKCTCLPYYLNQFNGNSAPVCNSVQLQCIVNASISLMFLQGDLRSYLPPDDFGSGTAGDQQQLFCQHCRPTCNEVSAGGPDSLVQAWESDVVIDVTGGLVAVWKIQAQILGTTTDANQWRAAECSSNFTMYEIDIEATKDLAYENQNHNKKSFDGYIDVYYTRPGAVMYTRDVTYDFIQILANLGGIGGLFLGGSILSITEIIYWGSKAAIAFFRPSNPLEVKTVHSRMPFY